MKLVVPMQRTIKQVKQDLVLFFELRIAINFFYTKGVLPCSIVQVNTSLTPRICAAKDETYKDEVCVQLLLHNS